jgi:hypothetical protein
MPMYVQPAYAAPVVSYQYAYAQPAYVQPAYVAPYGGGYVSRRPGARGGQGAGRPDLAARLHAARRART